jgi:CheY-like chemotaxis protein
MRILCAYMKRLGHNYVTAEDGQIAVDKFKENPSHYGCILMDINMPRLDGIQATRQIREFETANKLTPLTVIALSALASASVQKEAFQSGIDLFLTKPVKLEEIRQILQSRNLL